MSMVFVIPYRDRADHLAQWMRHYKKIFKEDLNVIVCEQVDSLGFARAPLFNCAFLEEAHKYDYAAYSDVDMMIDPRKCDPFEIYSYPINPTHVAVHLTRSNFTRMYETFFGGVCLITKWQMLEVDGWINCMFGWSSEDSAMYEALMDKGFQIDRRAGYFNELKHKRNLDPKVIRANNNLYSSGRQPGHGMKDQKYTLISREQHPDGYLHLKVSFDETFLR